MPTPKDLPRDVGGFIRDLRRNAKISLRQLADQAGVSNPYLSQIERGLRKPSAEVLQQLASALRVSTPVMYLRAGLLDDPEGQGVLASIAADPDLTMAQKQSLSQIYETFRRENLRQADPEPGAAPQSPTGPAPAASPTDRTPAAPAPASPPTDRTPAAPTAGSTPIPTALPPAGSAAAPTPTAAVIESVAVTESGSAAAPTTAPEPAPTPVRKTARKAVRKAASPAQQTAPAVKEEKDS